MTLYFDKTLPLVVTLLAFVLLPEAVSASINDSSVDTSTSLGRRLTQDTFRTPRVSLPSAPDFPSFQATFAPFPSYLPDNGNNGGRVPSTGAPPSFTTFPHSPPARGGNKLSASDEYPLPKGGNQEWDIVATGLLKAKPEDVWNAIKDPRRALAIAYRQFAYEVTRLGRTIDITLNSGQQMIYTVEETNERSYFHHFILFGHTQKIFNIAPTYVNIRRSQLFIHVRESAGNSEIVIGLQLQANPPRTKQQVQFFLQGFLTQLVDHFQMTFGVGDCRNPGHRETLGICNNPLYPLQGASETPLQRLKEYDPVYADNNFKPAPHPISPRHISNTVCSQGTDADNASNALNIADMFVFFGQFIDHDVGISPTGSFAEGEQPLFSYGHAKFKERFDIKVPKNDPDFKGIYRKETLPFDRSIYVREDGRSLYPRIQPNAITSYLDLSQVYSADKVRAKALRSFIGGKLRTSGKPNAPFLPFNGGGPGGVNINLENAPNSESSFYVAGDIRASENPVLASLHTLFLLEHNRVAEEIAVAFQRRNKKLTDEQLFQYARDVCVAEYQSIVFNEWLPILLGPGVVSPRDYRYDPRVDASLDVFFTTASFRFGHSMVNNVLWKRDLTGRIERVPLQDVFFNPDSVGAYTFSKYLLGAIGHEARELDEKVVDGLRSKLFTKDGEPSTDLVSLNIQRGRDHGIPFYNQARLAYGLRRAQRFSDITHDLEVQRKLSRAYNNNIDLVDAFVGGLAEKKLEGKLLGELFHISLKDQFMRLRDGDRFFYKKFPFDRELLEVYPRVKDVLEDRVTLLTIIYRNTDITPSVIHSLHGRRSTAFVL